MCLYLRGHLTSNPMGTYSIILFTSSLENERDTLIPWSPASTASQNCMLRFMNCLWTVLCGGGGWEDGEGIVALQHCISTTKWIGPKYTYSPSLEPPSHPLFPHLWVITEHQAELPVFTRKIFFFNFLKKIKSLILIKVSHSLRKTIHLS